MIYPTIKVNEKVHAVKSEMTCMCGLKYRADIPKKSKDIFKPIHFSKVENINCKRCKTVLGRIDSSKK
jgi:hypothetical protein